jgi:hypothetical protein
MMWITDFNVNCCSDDCMVEDDERDVLVYGVSKARDVDVAASTSIRRAFTCAQQHLRDFSGTGCLW